MFNAKLVFIIDELAIDSAQKYPLTMAVLVCYLFFR